MNQVVSILKIILSFAVNLLWILLKRKKIEKFKWTIANIPVKGSFQNNHNPSLLSADTFNFSSVLLVMPEFSIEEVFAKTE